MEDKKEILDAISELGTKIAALDAKIDAFETRTETSFKSVNKRLDGIEYEFKKIDTVLGYKEIYNYVPS
jgi:regulator of replication initiation timing